MKFFVLALFVALAYSAPAEESADAVEVVVNGLAEGEPLEIGDVLGVKVKEIVDGQIIASNDPLFPMSAQGIADAAAAAQPDLVNVVEEGPTPVEVIPVMPVLPEVPSILPDLVPEAIIALPAFVPEHVAVPELIVPNPEAEVIAIHPELIIPNPEPEAIVVPELIIPEGLPETVQHLPEHVDVSPNGEIFNDGIVQVTVNTPEDAGVFASVQSWFNMVINYFNGPEQTTHQIV